MKNKILSKRKLMHAPIFKAKLKITYTCPFSKETVKVDITDYILDIEGGCSGHPEDSYCYCSSPEASVTINCPSCGGHHAYSLGN